MKSNVFEIQFQDELEVVGLGVDTITEIDLIPKVELREDDYMYTLTGMLLLKGKYKPITKSTPTDLKSGINQPWLAKTGTQEEQKLDKAFPIRVMIPSNRIEVKEQVQVLVEDIRTTIKDESTIILECKIVIRGISDQQSEKIAQQQEEKLVQQQEKLDQQQDESKVEDYSPEFPDYNSVIDDNEFIKKTTDDVSDDDWKKDFTIKQRTFPWYNEREAQSDYSDKENKALQSAFYKPYSFLEEQEQSAAQMEDQASQLRKKMALKEEEDRKQAEDKVRKASEEKARKVNEEAVRKANEEAARKETARQEADELKAKEKVVKEQLAKEQAAKEQASKKTDDQTAQIATDNQLGMNKEELSKDVFDNTNNKSIEDETNETEEVQEDRLGNNLEDVNDIENVEDAEDVNELDDMEMEDVIETPQQVKVRFSKTGLKEKTVTKETVADEDETAEKVAEKPQSKSDWWKAWDSENSFTPIKYYIIQKDDDINTIVDTYKISRLELLSANKKLEAGEWKPGMRIRIPGA